VAKDDDREKFVYLANKRVNNAIKAIKLIGNLSNRSNYHYTQDDVKKIFSALRREIRMARDRFTEDSVKDDEVFQL
jgi:hypothetical protein